MDSSQYKSLCRVKTHHVLAKTCETNQHYSNKLSVSFSKQSRISFFTIILCRTGYQATVYLNLPPKSETKWPFDASNGLQVGDDLRGRGPCLMGGRVSAPPAALSLDVTPTSRAFAVDIEIIRLGTVWYYTVVPILAGANCDTCKESLTYV